jgi:hypothetical protein
VISGQKNRHENMDLEAVLYRASPRHDKLRRSCLLILKKSQENIGLRDGMAIAKDMG